MADRDFQGAVVPIPLPRRGINLYANIADLNEQEALQTYNLVVRGALRKRGGTSKFETDEVQASKAIVGLTKFYYGAASSQVIAVSDTDVRYHNGTTWVDIVTNRTAGLQTYMNSWGALGKLYVCNGTDTPFSWDGSSDSNLSGTGVPSQALQVLPYRDRLLFIDNANLGYLGWSRPYSDSEWEALANASVRPSNKLYGMILHSEGNDNRGLDTKVLIAGSTDMHLFSGTSLNLVTGDWAVDDLGVDVGCVAPRTMAWTPRGSMWLGNDRMVYLLPFNSMRPVPIGQKIKSNQTGVTFGTDSISGAGLPSACATYQDGYYMLSYPKNGGTVNDTQMWLDVENLHQDEIGQWGPWFGPMVGPTISVFANTNGPGDNGGLLGGEATAATGSFVYILNEDGTYADVSADILTKWVPPYNSYGNQWITKRTHGMGFEVLDNKDGYTVGFFDITGVIGQNVSVPTSVSRTKYGGAKYGAVKYASSGPIRKTVNIDTPVDFRRLSTTVTNTSSTDDVQIYSAGIKLLDGDLAFEEI